MASYCTEGFYRKKEGVGGSIINPEPILSEDAFCEKCKIVAEKIKITPKSSSEAWPGGGRLIRIWDEITVKCPKCKKIGVYTDNYREEDGSYYSNEERRAYRIKD